MTPETRSALSVHFDNRCVVRGYGEP